MDAKTIVQAQLERGRGLIGYALEDLTPEQLHHVSDGSTIQSIAAIYMHMVQSEDALINAVVRGQPLLMERGNWGEKIGFPHERDMTKLTELVKSADMAAIHDYAQAVYAETDAYIASLSDADLDRVVTFGAMGDFPLGVYLGSVVVWHAFQHTGEICALAGNLGGRGLPF